MLNDGLAVFCFQSYFSATSRIASHMWNIVRGLVCLAGGAGGQLGLCGTNSSGGLMVVGGILILMGIVQMVKAKSESQGSWEMDERSRATSRRRRLGCVSSRAVLLDLQAVLLDLIARPGLMLIALVVIGAELGFADDTPDTPVPSTATKLASVNDADQSAKGWLIHRRKSEYQAGPTEIKVLLPLRLETGKRYPVLYVLPVEANDEHRYGDGLAEVQRCDIHNKYGVICVAPTFAHLPWYADHPTDKSIRQESYFVKEVVPLIERHYPADARPDGRWLLGFSKSGWGAWSLLARHPDLFGRAAAWDAPLEMPRFDLYGAAQVFGTQEHFEAHRVLPALKNRAALAHAPSRLVLTGFDNFREHHINAHRHLEGWQIDHLYRDGPQRKHVWDSGWVEEAVALLASLKPMAVAR